MIVTYLRLALMLLTFNLLLHSWQFMVEYAHAHAGDREMAALFNEIPKWVLFAWLSWKAVIVAVGEE